jgi:hypothetical protein
MTLPWNSIWVVILHDKNGILKFSFFKFLCKVPVLSKNLMDIVFAVY